MSAQSDSRLTPLTRMLQSIFSDNSNIMLAAIISLLLVILFVLLLHLYAKWFLAQAQAQAQARSRSRSRRSRRPTVTVSDVLGPPRFHHFHTFNLQDSPASNSPSKGLDSAAIAAIPVFVYAETGDRDKEQRTKEHELECVICLSAFVDAEIGRSLPKCGHAFHVECIDMWLTSHSSCPICRAPIAGGNGIVQHDSQTEDSSGVLEIVVDSHSSETSENEHGNEGSANNSNNDNGGVSDNSAISVSETSSSLLRCSFKRMLSKVFPSANVNELNQ